MRENVNLMLFLGLLILEAEWRSDKAAKEIPSASSLGNNEPCLAAPKAV